jgi:hypothetical protein
MQQQTVDARPTELQVGKPCKTGHKDNALDTDGPITSGLHHGCSGQILFNGKKPTAHNVKVVSPNVALLTNKSDLSQKERTDFS